jgi:hypothetical protein
LRQFACQARSYFRGSRFLSYHQGVTFRNPRRFPAYQHRAYQPLRPCPPSGKTGDVRIFF